jgi:hypothetical protein
MTSGALERSRGDGRGYVRAVRSLALAAVVTSTAAAVLVVSAPGDAVSAAPSTATVSVRVRDVLRPGSTGSYTWARVTSSPAGIDCPGDCTADFARGSTVDLRAQPRRGYALTGWHINMATADCTGLTCPFTVEGDTLVEASMQPSSQLVAHTDGAGKLVFDPVEAGQPRHACGYPLPAGSTPRDCYQRYPAGTRVTVRALVDRTVRGARFLGWSHPDCPGLQTSCTFTMPRWQLDLYARFDPVYLTVAEMNWTVAFDPPTPACKPVAPHPQWLQRPRVCVVPYPLDTAVTLTRGPLSAAGMWEGSCGGSTPTCSTRMYENRYVVAGIFRTSAEAGSNVGEGIRLQYHGPPGGRIEIRSLTQDGGVTTCRRSCTSQLFDHGEQVEVRGRSGPGARFVRWANFRTRGNVVRVRVGTRDPVRAIFAHR